MMYINYIIYTHFMKNLIAIVAMMMFSVAGCAQAGEQPDFKDAGLVTMKGDSVMLSDYVGKHDYVLVDFWASWCGPCMREMPNVKAAYAKYKSRGLEIVGISLDRESRAWQGAVTRMEMAWPQLTDVTDSGSKAAKLYGVQYIPYTLIFDKKGKIVAKNLHGQEMLDKLEELMPARK